MYAIYSWAVDNTTATFDLTPPGGFAFAASIAPLTLQGDVLVLCDTDLEQDNGQGVIIGYAALWPFGGKQGYWITREISIYLAPQNQAKGFGPLLLRELMERARATGVKTLIARITEGNGASEKLFTAHGFTLSGTLKVAAEKFGRLHSVGYWQAQL